MSLMLCMGSEVEPISMISIDELKDKSFSNGVPVDKIFRIGRIIPCIDSRTLKMKPNSIRYN